MKKVAQSELKKRAKALYFDKLEKLEVVFADEYGRFSYNPETLVEINRKKDVDIFKIDRKDIKGIDATKVVDFSKKDDVDKEIVSKKKAAK